MPIYEYRCVECQQVFEEWNRHIDDGATPHNCPICKGSAHRLISSTSFALKGGGWYATEYGTHKNYCKKEETPSTGPAASSDIKATDSPQCAAAAGAS